MEINTYRLHRGSPWKGGTIIYKVKMSYNTSIIEKGYIWLSHSYLMKVLVFWKRCLVFSFSGRSFVKKLLTTFFPYLIDNLNPNPNLLLFPGALEHWEFLFHFRIIDRPIEMPIAEHIQHTQMVCPRFPSRFRIRQEVSLGQRKRKWHEGYPRFVRKQVVAMFSDLLNTLLDAALLAKNRNGVDVRSSGIDFLLASRVTIILTSV